MNYPSYLTPEEYDNLVTFFKTYLVAILCIGLVVTLIHIIAMWKLFKKSGEAGWKSLIPFYSNYIYYKISGVPSLFWVALVLSLISVVNNNIIVTIALIGAMVVTIYQCYNLSKAYGHGVGYTLGLLFLNVIFILILGFGSSEYKLEK